MMNNINRMLVVCLLFFSSTVPALSSDLLDPTNAGESLSKRRKTGDIVQTPANMVVTEHSQGRPMGDGTGSRKRQTIGDTAEVEVQNSEGDEGVSQSKRSRKEDAVDAAVQRRLIILDTETTGLYPLKGDRIVEIGCLELIDQVATGKKYQQYLNPERDIPQVVINIHGITPEMVADKPIFSSVADEFLAFIGDSTIIAHNAEFDLGFLNAELARINYPTIESSRSFCTQKQAKGLFPGQPSSLKALCQRFGIDDSRRTLHGALLDSELLLEVYFKLQDAAKKAPGSK